MNSPSPRFLVDASGNVQDLQRSEASILGAPEDAASRESAVSERKGSVPLFAAAANYDRPSTSVFVLRTLILLLISIPISIGSGFLYNVVQTWSAEALGLQVLIYPGIGAGALAGFAIYVLSDALDVGGHVSQAVVAFCAGLTVVVARWYFATEAGETILTHLINESHIHGTFLYAGEHHAHSESSPTLFWLVSLAESFVTVLMSVRLSRFGTFEDVG